MKIFLATSELPPTPSGMARMAGRLIEGFRARGHDVDVLAAERMPRIAIRDVRIPALAPRWRGVSRRARAADVVALHGPVPAFSDAFLLLSRAHRDMPPIAYTHHMDIRFRHGGTLTAAYGRLYRRLMRRAALTIVSTDATARTFGPHPRPPVHVVPFGVDHERVRGDVPKTPDFTLLFVGQLRPYKGIDVLLRAMQGLQGVRLRIAGRGYAEAEYRAMASRLGVAQVEFLGQVSDDDLWRLYAESHAFVLPSTEMEYFGIATLEAMASGCPPIISDLPGPVEVVGDAGVVVARGDEHALRAAIAALRDDPARRATLRDRARARAAAFTWDRCVEQHLALYAGLLGTELQHGTTGREQAAG